MSSLIRDMGFFKRSSKSLFGFGKKEGKETTYYTDGMKYTHDNLIGNHAMIAGPFGERRMTYADYTASGRCLYMIENYLAKYVLSYYGNTHTTTSFASIQTGKFRDDAKSIIRQCCNANSEDAVIFCGSGATGAIHKLIGVLGMSDSDIGNRCVVFLGPYEHHSNILPWKETGAKLVRIKEDNKGLLDLQDLEYELKQHQHGEYEFKVGTFSACSNVTGLLVDTIRVTQLMHMYGGLAFWDYAAGAPYMDMDMNPKVPDTGVSANKDALFCSPHKFVGGPGSPGLLIAKKKLFTNPIPHGTGGGTVVYVTNKNYSYTRDIEVREEGGTPGIIESIRAGLAFQLKANIGVSNIQNREEYLARKGIRSLNSNPNIIILGSKVSPRVPILSFCIKHAETNKLLHHNFVAVLLNDLFGVQARGGCACAGPYAQNLLGIADDVADGIMAFLDSDRKRNSIMTEDGKLQPMDEAIRVANTLGIMKPGFVRLNLAYFMTDEEVDFILAAVNIVADEGWKFLPQYHFEVEHGSWHHKRQPRGTYKLMSLNDISYTRTHNFEMTVHGTIHSKSKAGKEQSYESIISETAKIVTKAEREGNELYSNDEPTMKEYLPDTLLPYIWWLEPHYAMMSMRKKSSEALRLLRTVSIPIKPRELSGPLAQMTQPSRLAKIIRAVPTDSPDHTPTTNNWHSENMEETTFTSASERAPLTPRVTSRTRQWVEEVTATHKGSYDVSQAISDGHKKSMVRQGSNSSVDESEMSGRKKGSIKSNKSYKSVKGR